MIVSAGADRLIVGVPPLELGQHVKSADHAAEYGVLAVEVFRRHEGEEKLRAARVAAGMGHAQTAAEMQAMIGPVAFAGNAYSPVHRFRRPSGSPPWAMKPGSTRWNFKPL